MNLTLPRALFLHYFPSLATFIVSPTSTNDYGIFPSAHPIWPNPKVLRVYTLPVYHIWLHGPEYPPKLLCTFGIN